MSRPGFESGLLSQSPVHVFGNNCIDGPVSDVLFILMSSYVDTDRLTFKLD